MYGIVKNNLITTTEINYGDTVKVNKDTYEVSNTDVDIENNKKIYML